MADMNWKNADRFEGSGNVDHGKSGTGGTISDLCSKAKDRRLDPDMGKSGTGASLDKSFLAKANDRSLDPNKSK